MKVGRAWPLKRPPSQKMTATAFFSVFALLLVWLTNHIAAVKLPDAEHPLEIYSNTTRDDLRRLFVTAIGGAKQSVLLIIYTLTDQEVMGALKQKAADGVSVTVICDSKTSTQVKRKLGSQVKTIRRTSLGLMHQKILVIDEKQTWLGSANMTTESLRIHGNLVLGVQHPALAENVWAKARSMQLKPSARAAAALAPEGAELAGYAPFSSYLADGQKIDLSFLPDDKAALERLVSLMDQAKKTMRIAMFTWTHPKLTQAVINAHRRGVNVEAYVDFHSGRGVSAEVVHNLAKAGVKVSLSQGSGLLHFKTLYIDDAILVNGSANWTRAAFTQNDDCFFVVHALTEAQQNKMRRLFDILALESTPVSK